jgi:hypothetical protein
VGIADVTQPADARLSCGVHGHRPASCADRRAPVDLAGLGLADLDPRLVGLDYVFLAAKDALQLAGEPNLGPIRSRVGRSRPSCRVTVYVVMVIDPLGALILYKDTVVRRETGKE